MEYMKLGSTPPVLSSQSNVCQNVSSMAYIINISFLDTVQNTKPSVQGMS